MTKSFTIKSVQVQTDGSGVFSVQPVTEAGYNILQTSYYAYSGGTYAAIAEITGAQTINSLFMQITGNGLTLDDMATSASTRLYGMNQFKAMNNSSPVVDAEVSILMVIWH